VNEPSTLSEAKLLIKRMKKANERLRAIISQQAKKIEALEAVGDGN